MTIVVDASFAGAWILPDEHSGEAQRVLDLILKGREELAVPDLWTYEMLNLLLVGSRRGRIDTVQIEEALQLLDQIPCLFYDPHSELSRIRVARLASRFELSAYDAAYLELADRLQCPLYSFDKRLEQSAQALGLRG